MQSAEEKRAFELWVKYNEFLGLVLRDDGFQDRGLHAFSHCFN
jgi:hypothetical protein